MTRQGVCSESRESEENQKCQESRHTSRTPFSTTLAEGSSDRTLRNTDQIAMNSRSETRERRRNYPSIQ